MDKARVASLVGTLAVVMAGLFSVGCGRSPAYDPEPEFPQGYSSEPPPPLTNDELAARMQAQGQADAQADAAAQGSQDVAIGAHADEYGDTDPSALTEWRPVLDGHGQWVDDPTYGTVWVPAASEVGNDFQPYVTAGHWTYGDDPGWVWVSDYDWGWVPFHYGRWVYLPTNGWVWIPGRRYSGAWVVWRTGPVDYGYVGWAPAPPSWYWYNGVAVGWSFGWYDYHRYDVYCRHDYLYHQHVNAYVVRGPAARVHDARTADYVPAQPGVNNGGRVLAQPSVSGGRVLASPSVGSSARGPRPQDVGIKGDTVVAPPKNNAGLARAQAFASARSAMSLGARPPAQAFVAGAAPTMHTAGAANVAPLPGRQSSAPVFRPSPGVASSSSFASRPVPAYTAPRSSSGPLPELRPMPSHSASIPSSAFRPSSPSFSSASPSFRSPPAFASRPATPSFRSSPSFSSSPAFHSSSPHFSSSPSFSAAPSFHSSPSFSSHASAPSFHSSPSFSHAAPSVSHSFHPSAGSVHVGGHVRGRR